MISSCCDVLNDDLQFLYMPIAHADMLTPRRPSSTGCIRGVRPRPYVQIIFWTEFDSLFFFLTKKQLRPVWIVRIGFHSNYSNLNKDQLN